MKTALVLALAMLLSGCGPSPLARLRAQRAKKAEEARQQELRERELWNDKRSVLPVLLSTMREGWLFATELQIDENEILIEELPNRRLKIVGEWRSGAEPYYGWVQMDWLAKASLVRGQWHVEVTMNTSHGLIPSKVVQFKRSRSE